MSGQFDDEVHGSAYPDLLEIKGGGRKVAEVVEIQTPLPLKCSVTCSVNEHPLYSAAIPR